MSLKRAECRAECSASATAECGLTSLDTLFSTVEAAGGSALQTTSWDRWSLQRGVEREKLRKLWPIRVRPKRTQLTLTSLPDAAAAVKTCVCHLGDSARFLDSPFGSQVNRIAWLGMTFGSFSPASRSNGRSVSVLHFSSIQKLRANQGCRSDGYH